jgi:hypothetical protein
MAATTKIATYALAALAIAGTVASSTASYP